MRIRGVSMMLCAIGLACLSAVGATAQESPEPSLYPNAQTMVADYLSGADSGAAFASSGACPDAHPWYRTMVDRLAEVELTTEQTRQVARSWHSILHCGDPVVEAWYSGAFIYATDYSAGKVITQGLLRSGRAKHMAALEAAAFNPETPGDVRYGLHRTVINEADLALQEKLLLGAIEAGSYPSVDLLREGVDWLTEREENDEFIRSVANLIESRPGIQYAGSLLSSIAFIAALPESSEFSVARPVVQDVLDAIESFKNARLDSPMSVESRDMMMPTILEYEANLRVRLGAG